MNLILTLKYIEREDVKEFEGVSHTFTAFNFIQNGFFYKQNILHIRPSLYIYYSNKT